VVGGLVDANVNRLRDRLRLLGRACFVAIAWIPFVGGLDETSPRDHLEALRELVIGQIIATVPLWAGAVHVAWPELSFQPLMLGFREMVKNGELFIYAASTLAPIIYIVSRERDLPRAFPAKFWYLGLVLIGTIVAATVYISQRVKTQPITDSTLYISLWVYVGSLTILYLAFVYNNTYWPDPPRMMMNEERDYTQRVRDHR